MKNLAKLALLVAVLLVGLLASARAGEIQERPDSPARMPEWTLTTPDGGKIEARDFQGQVLILNFWDTSCHPCQAAIPALVELQRRHGSEGLQVIGFSLDRHRRTHDGWVAMHDLNYPSYALRTPEGIRLLGQFREQVGPLGAIPTTMFVRPDGTVASTVTGPQSLEDLEAVLRTLSPTASAAGEVHQGGTPRIH